MSTHVFLSGSPVGRQRSLLEACNFCDASAGEPCRLTSGPRNEPADPYICPDDGCEQLYTTAHEALNCVLHEKQNV